jgi:hypothetical protein
MALDKEVERVVVRLIQEFELNDNFKNSFLKYLDRETNLQVEEDERLQVIDVLRSYMREK